MVGVYRVSADKDYHDQFLKALVNNLDSDQFPFTLEMKNNRTSCQVVLSDEQVMILKLSVSTVTIKKLVIKDEIDIPLKDSAIG